VQDPATHLLPFDVVLDSAVDPSRTAVLDPDHWVRVNHEIYFVADAVERAAFLEDPVRYCGVITDPVTGERFHPLPTSPRLDYEGRPYYFLSENHRTRFQADPVPYADPTGKMVPPSAG
jgi:YHS domain-containing protein